MRHGKKLIKLARPTDQRLALLRSLSRELLIQKRISTTAIRAKATQGYVEQIIMLARRGDLNARRHALRLLPDRPVIKQLFLEAQTLWKERTSGFTRVVKSGWRRGDAAPRVFLELVEKPEK
jgi:large subunit ribosomal protein L17